MEVFALMLLFWSVVLFFATIYKNYKIRHLSRSIKQDALLQYKHAKDIITKETKNNQLFSLGCSGKVKIETGNKNEK